MDVPNAPAAPSEDTIPANLVRRMASWSDKAQHYPVFSQTWYAYRVRAYLLPLGVLGALLCIVAVFIAAEMHTPAAYLALAAAWLLIAIALLLGRGLAVLIRKRNWPRTGEAAAISGALLLGVVLAAALVPLTHISAPPGAPGAAAQSGRSATGDRRSLAGPTGLSAAAAQVPPNAKLANLVVWSVLLIWFGGARDLHSYFRQARLLRDAALLDRMERYKHERNQVEIRLSVLASQVEPHFLFNTLSGVRAAILSDPARGVEIIDHLVEYLRATIPEIRADGSYLFVRLASQFDAARAYLGVIRARMPRLTFTVSCDAGLADCAVPPLMLISLVENAVKHGIERKKGPAHINVSARRQAGAQGELLVLTVQDNGAGFGQGSAGSGIGLSNIRERLGFLYGESASLTLLAGDAGGVEARITLPLSAIGSTIERQTTRSA